MRGASCLVCLCALSGSATAHTFLEDWESGTTLWRTVGGGPVVIDVDPSTCSTRYQRETVRFAGARVLTKAAVPVTAGQSYCLTAWVRASAGAKPQVGIQRSDGAGVPAAGTEVWLLGGQVPIVSDGWWRYYKAPFVAPQGWSFLVIGDALSAAGAAGNADIDDINLDPGACPTGVIGPPHLPCAAPRKICTDSGKCVQCTATDTSACMGTTPECDVFAGICIGCSANGDCGDTRPVCDTTKHMCRGCLGDNECGGFTGPACQPSGACGQCSATNQTACQGSTPVCEVKSGTCVGCGADLGCGDLGAAADAGVVDLAGDGGAADLAAPDIVVDIALDIATDIAAANDIAAMTDFAASIDIGARADLAAAADLRAADLRAADLAPVDAAVAADGGAAAPGGCGCSLGSGSAPPWPSLLLLAAALMPLIRTRPVRRHRR